jgi:hypothetical protein
MERKILPSVVKKAYKEFNEVEQNRLYWMSKTPQQRIAAVTFLSMQSLKPEQRMDKSIIAKFKMHL